MLSDNNLSPKLTDFITSSFPDSAHLVDKGLHTADDFTIWTFATLNQFTIVTQDSDFNKICQLRGFPPKVIWLPIGNSKTSFIKKLLVKNIAEIAYFIVHSKEGVLELY